MQAGHAAPTRVLVLDDEPSIRLLCRVVLELEGWEVLEAESLAGARQALSGDGADVVVMDLNLRGERSLALVAECHAREPRIPVILVTGSIDVHGESAPGADAILGKPFEVEELVSLVKRLAGRPQN